MEAVIKHVYGNQLRLAIPLEALKAVNEDGEVQVVTEPLVPVQPVTVTLENSIGQRFSQFATMNNNTALVDFGSDLPIGTYALEITCKDDSGQNLRYKQHNAVEVFDTTAETHLFDGDKIIGLKARIFWLAGGGSGTTEGVGIASIETVESDESGGSNVVTITLTNGEVRQFSVRNGNDAPPAQNDGGSQLAIEVGNGKVDLFVRGAKALLDKGYVPCLFRYTKKRNVWKKGQKPWGHSIFRKGWNFLGNADTAYVDEDERVYINPKSLGWKEPEDYDDSFVRVGHDDFTPLAKHFVHESVDGNGGVCANFGKTKIAVKEFVEDYYNEYGGMVFNYRRVRLRYGIAFAKEFKPDVKQFDPSTLVTPIVPFHVCTTITQYSYEWVFER